MYPVNDLYLSIQGEGVNAGVPMVLLRLQGCAVGCPWCDTRQTWALDAAHEVMSLAEAQVSPPAWVRMTAARLVEAIDAAWPHIPWVLVTGGEPADNDLRPLVVALHDTGRRVALETSGTATGHLDASFDWVCVSPKLSMPGGKAILLDAVRSAHEIKHVVGRPSDIAALVQLLNEAGIDQQETAICLQPVSQSERATQVCIAAVQEHNWRLSLQTHKFVALP